MNFARPTAGARVCDPQHDYHGAGFSETISRTRHLHQFPARIFWRLTTIPPLPGERAGVRGNRRTPVAGVRSLSCFCRLPQINPLRLTNPRSGHSAFTLIEVVIASALMALILVSAYACLTAGYASQKTITPRTEILQNARVAMALVAADLRAACPLAGDTAFLGTTRTLETAEADNLDFATHNYTPRRPGEGDYCEESIFVDKDAQTGETCLFRRRNPRIAMDPLSGGSREEIASGLRGLKLEYFDGLDWYATWGELKSPGKQATSEKAAPNLSGLPAAVRITLYMDSDPKPLKARPDSTTASSPQAAEVTEARRPPPLVFQTVARLNLAEASSGGSSDATGPDNSGAPNPGNNNN